MRRGKASPKTSKKNRGNSQTANHARLPSIVITPTTSTVARYALHSGSSGETIYGITMFGLLSSLGIVAATANSGYPIFRYFKLNKISIWGSAPSFASGLPLAPSVGIKWYSNVNFGTNTIVSDSSLSTAYPAYLTTRPPRGSYASLWQFQNTNVLFDILVSDVQSVFVDMHYSARMDDQSYAANLQGTVNSMTIGSVYYTALDGVTSNAFQRQLLPPIS